MTSSDYEEMKISTQKIIFDLKKVESILDKLYENQDEIDFVEIDTLIAAIHVIRGVIYQHKRALENMEIILKIQKGDFL